MTPASYILLFGTATAAIVCAIALPLWRRLCPRLGLMDAPGERKLHARPIPLAGGLSVLTGILGAIIIVLCVNESARTLFLDNIRMWTAILGGALFMTLLGIIDDRHQLSAGVKFALQLALALGVAAAGLRVTLFVPNLAFQYAITALWILTVINAFNFMDNMNGLCAGLGAIAAATFAAAAAQQGQQAEALLSMIVCGALLGFLPYNYPRASAFLGDAGSHLIGFCLAVLALLPAFHTEANPRPLAVLMPLLILALPLLDLLWVAALRTWQGKPFYVGDTNHLSHRLVRRGMSKTAAVALIWMMAAVAAVLALLL